MVEWSIREDLFPLSLLVYLCMITPWIINHSSWAGGRGGPAHLLVPSVVYRAYSALFLFMKSSCYDMVEAWSLRRLTSILWQWYQSKSFSPSFVKRNFFEHGDGSFYLFNWRSISCFTTWTGGVTKHFISFRDKKKNRTNQEEAWRGRKAWQRCGGKGRCSNVTTKGA